MRTQLLFVPVLAVALTGCGEDTGTVNDDGAPVQAEAAAGGSSDDGAAIRVYMKDMDELGEVAGLTTSREEFLDLAIALEDDDGERVSSAELEVSSLVGNELSDRRLETDGNGLAELRFRPILPGEDTLTFTGDGVSKQLTVYVTDEAFGHPLEHMEERATELPDVDGTVSWDLLGSVDSREGNHGLLEPMFSDELRELNGREVKVQGFMMPLDNSEKQQHFLVSRTPPSCFYCLPGGPESVIEVKAQRPMEFSFDPVVLSGDMQLVENSDMGLFYRLEDARRE
ncbi:DUF3299 domain-containing protein [Aquisalimonas sp.]|uniref:DUF3299 domain-containing protein n=1 Tax=Aquisalimonas sp. TaxID=1872621 RepID=UPI0025C6EF74|nr:DUF3299 domain-containing protein [Aquisalimonas sp.]